MKLHWGHKITISIIIFMLIIITMVYISVTRASIHMVSENYYEEELAYQKVIDKMTNARDWDHEITIDALSIPDHIRFSYPEGVALRGNIRFFRPSDSNLDFSVAMGSDGQYQDVPWANRKKGLWKIMMEWESEGQLFYREHKLILQ